MSTPVEAAAVQTLLSSFEGLLTELAGKASGGADLGEIERRLYFDLLGFGRDALQWLLEQAGPGDAGPAITAETDGAPKRYERRAPAPLPLRTVFGTVVLTRFVYVAKDGDCRFPLDAQLELSQKQVTPFLQQRLVRMAAKDAFGGVRDDLFEDLGLRMSRRTIEEIVSYRAEGVREFQGQIEPERTAPERLLIVNFDAKGIPILKTEHERRTWKNLRSGEKPNKRRMSTLATIHEVEPVEHDVEAIVTRVKSDRDKDSKRPTVENRVVLGDLEDRERVFLETRRQVLARMGPETTLVIGTDGDLHQMELIEKHFGDLDPLVVLDWYHLTTYLWLAAQALQPKNPEEYFERQARRLLASEVRTVIRGIRQSCTKRGGRPRQAVEDLIRYLENHAHIMDYATAIEMGAPIGTGSVEGACGNVVGTRMERPGMRWSVPGAQAVLHTRCLHVSGQLPEHHRWSRKREVERLHGWWKHSSLVKAAKTCAA
jgi:hypothetical protein